MPTILKDGVGTGNTAKVTLENELLTRSTIESDQTSAAIKGNSYQIGSGVVSLTSANESAVLIFINNEDEDIIISAINITSADMTGSSASVFLAKLYTKGTALSAGTSQTPLNNNLGSSKLLSSTVTAGQEAATITNGVASGAFYIPNNIFFNTEVAWVIPKGVSIAVSITPGADNTSFPISVTLEGHIKEVL